MTMNAKHEVKLTWTEISMITWTCEVKLNERKKSEELVVLLGSEIVSLLMKKSRREGLDMLNEKMLATGSSVARRGKLEEFDRQTNL